MQHILPRVQHIDIRMFFFKSKPYDFLSTCPQSFGEGQVCFSTRMRASSEQNSVFVCGSTFFFSWKSYVFSLVRLQISLRRTSSLFRANAVTFLQFSDFIILFEKCEFSECKMITFQNSKSIESNSRKSCSRKCAPNISENLFATFLQIAGSASPVFFHKFWKKHWW